MVATNKYSPFQSQSPAVMSAMTYPDGQLKSATIGGMSAYRDVLGEGLPPPQRQVTYDPASLFYDTSGKKLMFIFEHRVFQNTIPYPTHNEPPMETSCNVARLQETFGKPGRFEIDEPYNDLVYSTLIDKLQKIRRMDHSNTSCVVIVIIANGEENGTLWAADRPYPLARVINLILTAPSLAGKPKLFLIQMTTLVGGPLSSEISLVF